MYKVYLRKGGELQLIAEIDAETMWPPPNTGERLSLQVDGEEWPCEILGVRDPEIGIDGRTIISQDVIVQKIGK